VRHRLLGIALGAALASLLVAGPVGAQELVDAGEKGGGGGLAFVLFTIMVLIVVGALFFMDRVRRRASDDDGD
jgi:hypothetical protein